MNGKTAKLIRRFAKEVKLENTRNIKRLWMRGNHKERGVLRKEMECTVNGAS